MGGLVFCEKHPVRDYGFSGPAEDFRDIKAVTRSLMPSATSAAPKIMMTSCAAWKGLTTSRIPRTVGIRAESSSGTRMGSLDCMAAITSGVSARQKQPFRVQQKSPI